MHADTCTHSTANTLTEEGDVRTCNEVITHNMAVAYRRAALGIYTHTCTNKRDRSLTYLHIT